MPPGFPGGISHFVSSNSFWKHSGQIGFPASPIWYSLAGNSLPQDGHVIVSGISYTSDIVMLVRILSSISFLISSISKTIVRYCLSRPSSIWLTAWMIFSLPRTDIKDVISSLDKRQSISNTAIK